MSRATWVDQAVARFSNRTVIAMSELSGRVEASRMEGNPPPTAVISVWDSIRVQLASCHQLVVMAQATSREPIDGPDRMHRSEEIVCWDQVADAAEVVVELARSRVAEMRARNEGLAEFRRSQMPAALPTSVSPSPVFDKAALGAMIGRKI